MNDRHVEQETRLSEIQNCVQIFRIFCTRLCRLPQFDITSHFSSLHLQISPTTQKYISCSVRSLMSGWFKVEYFFPLQLNYAFSWHQTEITRLRVSVLVLLLCPLPVCPNGLHWGGQHTRVSGTSLSNTVSSPLWLFFFFWSCALCIKCIAKPDQWKMQP